MADEQDLEETGFTDVREDLTFPWSDYTLPDDYGPIIKRQNPIGTSPKSSISPVSSANTDPFEVDNQRSDSPFSNDETKLSTPTNPMSRKSSNTDSNSDNKSGGFDFTDIDGLSGDQEGMVPIPGVIPGPMKLNSPASFGFAMPDMGFFGVASPPHYTQIVDWMGKDGGGGVGPHIPIYRHRRSSSSEDSSLGGLGKIPIRGTPTDGDLSGLNSPRSIPNSPPQSPLYRRQGTKQAKICEDINENYQLINSPALFLQSKKCYDLIPNSGKLVVFDKKLLVRKAFPAFIAHGTRAAPIWDSGSKSYIGMLTITDFITILHHCYHQEGKLNIANIIENKTIEEWKVISERDKGAIGLISIDPTETLFTAAKMLLENKIHRLPVVDPRSGNTLYILTHKKILNHIYPYIIESQLDPFFDVSIKELGVGTYADVKQLKYDSKLIEAMQFFAKTRVSAIPIVDDEEKVVDIYARFDVITLASRGRYSEMDMSIRECLQLRSSQKVEVMTCKGTDSLFDVIKLIYSAQVHRLVVVNSSQHVVGLVSLSDLFNFLVLRSNYRPKVKSAFEEADEQEEAYFKEQFDFG